MVRRLQFFVFAVLAVLACACRAGEADVGVVLLHGKWDRPPFSVLPLARQLEGAGFKVVVPTLPWSGTREYDVTYAQALDEIDRAAQALRERRVTHIVVAGLSMGANAALAFAATSHAVDAVVALSPGQPVERPAFKSVIEPSLAKAKAMMDAGVGAERGYFEDRNQGRARTVNCPAEAYYSYFDPDGLANMQKMAAALPAPVPLFMAVGHSDAMATVAEASIFNRAPRHERSLYVAVPADHVGLATDIGPALVAWLRTLGF